MKDLYDAAAAVTIPLVRGVTDDQLDAPTPCRDYAVRDLVNHLYGVMVEFQKSARGEPMDFASETDHLEGDWREGFAAETRKVIDAWCRPGTTDGVEETFGMPRAVIGRMPLFDLTVHGWDLARSTGQEFRPDAGVVDDVYALARQLAPQGQQMGMFAESVAVSDDAPTVDRLIGLLGRDPNWKP
ncbi:MAG TPA: TIGR03086 family metal-binding protein [Stackebrandtia sp.]|jgi:uncharacterized protein (TIGR03086 family)|uniref:TIGR03086 family metal-binding protein n=1 Tax=Stackebrandtia sp. TaxID=2023065 RepID=UPI002D698CB0|nr:TIGR03086 family metal-binding protein [Stackebrandtia sp.]HZE41899.1 TIGR03086 family metal-binding protein [Stackebrandtia sp.]